MAKVYVKNIPYEADKNILIETLLSNGYGPINDCDLKMHKTRKNCNVGSGYVVFENEKDAKNCIAKAAFVRPICMGRPLYIYPATPRKKAETISDNAGDIKEEFFLSSLELGNWLSVTDKKKKKKSNNNQPFTFSSEWKYPEDYEKPRIYFSKTEEAFILEGFKGSDQDSVLRRVKIPFRILVGNSRGIILDQRDDEISLYITLKIPPYLYRKGEVNQLLWLLPTFILKKQPRIIEWIRTVDWTEAVFGRCMVYRLIFKDNLDELRNTLDKFRFRGIPRIPQIMISCVEKPVYLKKYEEQFQFLCELLPFNICYKLESLISYGILRPYEIEEFKLGERLSELIHNENQVDVALHALNQICTKYWDPFDERHKDRPITIFENVIKNFKIWHPQISLINNSRCAWINHATITPTNIYYDGPHYESSNRILRLYKDKIDYFLRVTFREENFERLFVNKDEDVDIIEQRIMTIINKGFKLAGRHYEFLVFSASQLRETSCWFVASNGDFNANFIRANMGEFEKIENPALYAARMGQCFTSTMGVLELNREQIKPLDEIVKNDLKFSDGCGKISPGLAELAAKEYWGTKNTKDKETPAVFQIRLGGCKGVVAVDPNLKEEGNVLYIRPSQKKFEAPSLNLEIVRTVKSPLPGHLNRQIILILSTLGVKDEVFITLQEEMLADINLMMTNEDKACRIVKRSTGTRECSHITRSIISMINAGLMRKNDLFLKAFLECKRIFTMKLLRSKARILVPDSFLLIGVIDETGILEENEIYVQTSTIVSEYQTFDTAHEKIQREKKIWKGPAVITRNPCLHPGDLRKVVAVEVPELSHLKNCVVFSQKGHKPLPNLLSGGDLDGDEFFVSFDKRILITENKDPMNYDPPDKKNLGRPVEITDICDFFKDFMLNNRLGQISNLHVAFADSEEEGVNFIGCKILAALHSKAVDFSKTGIPVTETLPNIEEYPDFMEKDHKKSYKSEKILGKLYRNIQLDKSENVSLLNYDIEHIILNEEFLFGGYEQYVEEAIIYRDYYNNEIRHLMKKYKVKTEAEIIAAQLLGRQVEGKKSQDIRESISGTVSFIIYYCRKQFLMGLGVQDTNDDGDIDDVTPFSLHVTIPINNETKAKASAWYYVTYNQEEYPDQGENILLSFPWVVADILLAIIH